MRDIQEEKLTAYRIKLYEANGYYTIKVTKLRPYPRGNYDRRGKWRGAPKEVVVEYAASHIEAWFVYYKLRRVWRHCYS